MAKGNWLITDVQGKGKEKDTKNTFNVRLEESESGKQVGTGEITIKTTRVKMGSNNDNHKPRDLSKFMRLKRQKTYEGNS